MDELTSEERKVGGVDLVDARETVSAHSTLRERLEKIEPRFQEMTRTFGVDGRIGFGSLPAVHVDSYTTGSIVELELVPGPAKTGFSYKTYPFNREEIRSETRKYEVGEEPEDIIVVLPRPDSYQPMFITIYQHTSLMDKQLSEQLLLAPDTVYEGLLAHELAHLLECGAPVPRKVRSFIKRYERETNPMPLEGKYDIIAAMYGYKDQVLAKLSYDLERLKTLQGKPVPLFYTSPEHIIRVIEARIRVVEEYCSDPKKYLLTEKDKLQGEPTPVEKFRAFFQWFSDLAVQNKIDSKNPSRIQGWDVEVEHVFPGHTAVTFSKEISPKESVYLSVSASNGTDRYHDYMRYGHREETHSEFSPGEYKWITRASGEFNPFQGVRRSSFRDKGEKTVDVFKEAHKLQALLATSSS